MASFTPPILKYRSFSRSEFKIYIALFFFSLMMFSPVSMSYAQEDEENDLKEEKRDVVRKLK